MALRSQARRPSLLTAPGRRWNRLSLLAKLLVPTALTLLLITVTLSVINYQSSRESIIDAENRQLEAAYQDYLAYLTTQSEHALALAMQIANQPAAQVAVAERDRDALMAAFFATYTALNAEFDIPQAQFHIPPATSLLRLHDPDSPQDDLSGFRFTVLDTNANRQPTYGIEVGRGGPGIRGVVPVTHNGEHVGSFEIGLNITATSLQQMQTVHGGDWHLYLDANAAAIATLTGFRIEEAGPVDGLLSFASTGGRVLPVEAEDYTGTLADGETRVLRLESGGEAYATFIAPLQDYRGQTIGVLQIDMNRDAVVAQIVATQVQTLTLSLGMSVVMLLLLWWVIRGALRPVHKLTQAAEAMTAGDLQVAIDVNTRDEVGRLAESFQTMAATLDTRMAAERADKQALEDTVSDYVAFVERVAAGNLAIRLGLNGRPHDGDSQADLYRLGEYLNSMVENLAEMAGQIRETVDSITPAVTGIQAVMTQTTATTTEQNAAITQTAATVEQVRATVEQTSQRAHAVMEISQESLNVSRNGTNTVADSIEGMRQIRQRVESIAENILLLSERTQQIGEIIDTVNALADQSKLLALNASIEASRAGTEGRGFAVVAMEVRQLAEESRGATSRVRDILSEIQQATNRAVMVTEEGSKGAEAGQALVEQAGHVIRELAATIEKAADAAVQIATSTQQQTTGIDQLVVAMSQIKQASQQTAVSARQTEDNTRDLAALAQRLETLATRYKL